MLSLYTKAAVLGRVSEWEVGLLLLTLIFRMWLLKALLNVKKASLFSALVWVLGFDFCSASANEAAEISSNILL
jgi:hypothetical protein